MAQKKDLDGGNKIALGDRSGPTITKTGHPKPWFWLGWLGGGLRPPVVGHPSARLQSVRRVNKLSLSSIFNTFGPNPSAQMQSVRRKQNSKLGPSQGQKDCFESTIFKDFQ